MADISKERVMDLALAASQIDHLQAFCHKENSRWWTDPKTGESILENPYVVPVKLLMVITEICEGVEGHRKGMKDSHLPQYNSIDVELADALIRIFDLAGALGVNLGNVFAEKVEFNAHRADHTHVARTAEGGKSY